MGSPGLAETYFVVTGATGWLGRASLGVLEERLGGQFETRVLAFASKACTTTLSSGRTVVCRHLNDLTRVRPGRYAFLHCAFLGKERVADLPLYEFIRLNTEIGELVCAAARRLRAVGIFVPSSGAVYRRDRSLQEDFEENPYGAMKLLDEGRFLCLAEELECPLAITRVFNIAGPYINKIDSYALGSILDDIRHRRPVVLRAAHPVIRSYVHVNDLVRLVLTCLDKEVGVTRFDTAGECEIEVGDLARTALQLLGWPEGDIRRPSMSGAPSDRYVGDRACMAALASRHCIGLRPLAQQIRDTADYLAQDK